MDWRGYALLAAVVLVICLLMPGPAKKVVFLDVGQGDSILLQDGTAQVLIDGGKGGAVLERLGEELPWFDRKIDVVITTHPDQDHLEGLVHVLERYEVGLVLLPQVPHTSALQAAWLERLRAVAERQDVAWRFAWAGQQVAAGDMQVRIIGPTPAVAEAAGRGKTNNASVIARVDFATPPNLPSPEGRNTTLSFLLTGDAEATVERQLVARYSHPLVPSGRGRKILDVDILKAGHHGSKTSTTAELLAAASPAAVVVSVGAENRYGHPHPTVLERLGDTRIWRTDEQGSVRFMWGKQGWIVGTER